MHTGSTDNYELTQFASTDKPAWLIDYNGDMRKIDAGMKGNADAIEALGESVGQESTDITELKERMATAEADIDGAQETIGTGELETQVKNLIGAANELLGLIRDNDTDIAQLQQGLAGVGDAIDGVAQLAYTIANVYDSTQTYAVGSYAIYQNTLYKCITAITVGEAFNPAKWTSVKVMNEISSGGGVTAAGVSYVNTDSGLSATNAQGAIDEIADKTLPTRTPNVRVTGDGVKTLNTILTEIADAIDLSKLTAFATISCVLPSTNTVYNAKISRQGNIGISWGYVRAGSDGSTYMNACRAIKTGQGSNGANISNFTGSVAATSSDLSSVVGNGDHFDIYY